VKPDDVPTDLVEIAMTGATPGCRGDARFYLANALPAHRLLVADEIERTFQPDDETDDGDLAVISVLRFLRGQCSQCGKPWADEPCGVFHEVYAQQMEAIRDPR
jgi:hypothetical protein